MGKKFTTKKHNIDFDIDDDTFYLRPMIPAGTLFEFSNIQSRMEEAQKDPQMTVGDVLLDVFSKILTDESFEIFNARFFGVTSIPIDLPTFQEVTEYILEEVTGKEQSQKSSTSKTG